MEFYLAIKENDIMTFGRKWMELEIIMLSEMYQSHNDKYCLFSPICGRQGETK
jgi:hypothetical protein